jgi:SOS-response transcriptional repressor LexA
MDLNAQAVSVPCFARLPEDRFGRKAGRAETFLTLDRRLAGERGAFFVEARGEELAALGLVEGDYILLEPASIADLSSDVIVAARVQERGGYYRFVRNGRSAQLHPVAGQGSPTLVEDLESLVILGRVKGMYRRMDHLSGSIATVTH